MSGVSETPVVAVSASAARRYRLCGAARLVPRKYQEPAVSSVSRTSAEPARAGRSAECAPE
jgi:hypothetical protein